MKQSKIARDKGIGALELIEEATALLRGAPVEVLALYYLGALPFALGVLYFWADMSRNADADARLAGASLLLALLFIWMKYWQSRFCGELSRLRLNGSAPPPASGVALAQAIFQPWSFVVMPVALLVTLPFGWCFAFFQNITVIGSGLDLRRIYGRARSQAALWQGQNHVLMGIFLLLGLVVFANLCIGAYLVPRMLKTLLGIESIFTRSNHYLLNSTFWAAMAVLTHICIDPLVKAVYLLRCHYGESLSSGADLLAEFRDLENTDIPFFNVGAKQVSSASPAFDLCGKRAKQVKLCFAPTVLILTAILSLSGVHPTHAGAVVTQQTDPRPAINSGQLDKTIEQVIGGPEFAWRLPRTAQEKAELPGFIRSALDLLKEWAADIGDWLQRFFKWLAGLLPTFNPKEESTSKGFGFPDYVFPLLYGLLAICLSIGGVLLWRQARRKRETKPHVVPPALVMEPDVSDENVTADELSQDRWSALARELLVKGELRLGVRALYLACLACLAEERLIAIARFKSNRDYERELGRFAHALPGVAASFASNVAQFEQSWYGMHRLEQGMVEAFMANYERIVSGVRQR
jgi:hypothetical protein